MQTQHVTLHPARMGRSAGSDAQSHSITCKVRSTRSSPQSITIAAAGFADTSRALAPGRNRQRLRKAEARHDAERQGQLMPVVCLIQHQGRVDVLLEPGPARHAHGARPELVSE